MSVFASSVTRRRGSAPFLRLGSGLVSERSPFSLLKILVSKVKSSRCGGHSHEES